MLQNRIGSLPTLILLMLMVPFRPDSSGPPAVPQHAAGTEIAASRRASLLLSARQPSANAPSPYGPQPTIACPAGAVDIRPGTSIQAAVDAHPGRTTYCLKAGVHTLSSSITPKTGNTFVGEYGAVLDGTGWTTTDDTQAAFRAHNQDIDDVTVRNLVIRHMPQRGIHAYPSGADGWTLENNEITGNVVGVVVPNSSVVRNNSIHHNVGNPKSSVYVEQGGAYQLYRSKDVVFENNEISYNSINQKVVSSVNVTFRKNLVHHNLEHGIWYDGDNVGSLIEDNVVEDNHGEGIFYEVSGQGIIRNNVVSRNGNNGIFISTSQSTEIYGNTLADNFRGIQFLLNCDAAGRKEVITYDLANNVAHDNQISVGAASGALANGFSYTGSCSPAAITDYLNGTKKLQFLRNTYRVPSAGGRYWLWDSARTWDQWRTFGHDAEGSVTAPAANPAGR